MTRPSANLVTIALTVVAAVMFGAGRLPAAPLPERERTKVHSCLDEPCH